MLDDERQDGMGQDRMGESRMVLPPVPAELVGDAVAGWAEPITLDTYLPVPPEPYPAFLERRVYQGSSGRVYPLPFHERISAEKAPHEWQAVHLENEYVRLVILPELGGRIAVGYDKVAGYDFFYRNNVIKPALVGLAGPWISGGVEFNWPQHHRPATFLPTDWTIEREPDGAVTVWCSDHDPFTRMKGMHGIRLRPGSSLIEARVRLYNRSEVTRTFLWWANVAAAVNDEYQSFFPTDVAFVADHAKRAVVSFPRVSGRYYGVDYPAQVTAERPDGDRLDWYRNIPVPTSYMVLSTEDDFFGGYDHGRDAGFVHWADRHLAPGKKQWTWGNAPFGWAWDRNLTDGDGPYVELMAGVFTDNQPDFSFLAPGETKTFSQYWYPIREIGPTHQATRDVAVRLDVRPSAGGTGVRIGVAATRAIRDARIRLLTADGDMLLERRLQLGPADHRVEEHVLDGDVTAEDLVLVVLEGEDAPLTWRPRGAVDRAAPEAATEPPLPADVETVEELILLGQYLAQYRHATRLPEPYWQEALRRDPGETRAHLALATTAYDAGLFGLAEEHLRAALARQLARVPNPADGEALYRLGITLVAQGRDTEAAGFLAKAQWNAAWRVPAGYALARLAGRAGDLAAAEQRLREVLRLDVEHLQANALLAAVLLAQDRTDEAALVLTAQLERDPLDQWTRDLAGLTLTADAPTLLDVALEYAGAGFPADALRVLDLARSAAAATPPGQVQVGPLVDYHRAAVLRSEAREDEAAEAAEAAAHGDFRHCLPSRLSDIAALEEAAEHRPGDSLAGLLLGSWYYDRRRYDDAIGAWRRALESGPEGQLAALLHRNYGIAAYNVLRDSAGALEHFREALRLTGDDPKLVYEYDQLLARTGATAEERLERLEQQPAAVAERDDLAIAFAELLTTVGRAGEAVDLLSGRRFQPWEGGEGLTLAAWDRAHLALAEGALPADPATALQQVQAALQPPGSLGEARHPLANTARLHLTLGSALALLGRDDEAREEWTLAAASTGDFLEMSTRAFGPQTADSIEALRRLGRVQEAERLTAEFAAFVDELAVTPGRIDFFATSLPSMLLFAEDPQEARDREVAAYRRQLADLTTDLAVPAATGPRQ